jgi:outer membrane protein assembly factor BamB
MRHRPGYVHPSIAACFAIAAIASLLSQSKKPESATSPAQAEWRQWRGPFFTGMAAGDAPLMWNDATNVRWKVEIPGRGHSSPIVSGNRIFLTTAIPTGNKTETPAPAEGGGRGGPGGGAGVGVEHRFEVLALDRTTGKILWQKTATTATPHEGYHRNYGSFASNSPATDGKRVYAFFGSRGLYAYDVDGRPLWQKDFGVQMKIRLQFGEGAAAVVDGDRLIVSVDHEGPGFIAMLDGATGREIWKTPRQEGTTWSQPFVAAHGGRKQIVVTATTRVRSYDFETGKQIWEAAGIGVNPIPTPVQQNDLIHVMSGYRNPNLMAIRLGREGDLTGTDAIAWSATRGLSYTASPVLHDNRLYVVTDTAQLTCFNASTGEALYQQSRLPKPYNLKASPVGANGKLYISTEEGDVIVVKMGDAFEVLATNSLTDQSFIATPAIAGGDIFLRSRTHLFRIAGTPSTASR